MSDSSYNGWTNYETWVVNLWLDNDGMSDEIGEWASESLQDAIDNDESDVRPSATYALSKRLEEYADEMQEIEIKTVGMFTDLLTHALGMVDWHEIAKHYIDQVTVYSAGWNMPGYMPDNAPAMFIDAALALEYVTDEIDRANNENDASETESSVDAFKADSKGEFGQTVGQYHYFVSIL